MSSPTSQSATLLKARQRHTRWFIALLVLVEIFSHGVIQPEGLLDEVLQWLGYALVIVCVLGRGYCSAFIGGIKNETVMQLGPYSVVRNPLYVFSFVGIAGIGLQSDSLVILCLLLAAFVVYYRQVVAREEAFLESRFGDVYRQYKQRVPRWFPALSLWDEPAEMLTRPYFIRQTLLDAAVFFVALPAFEILERLRESGVLPVLLVLP